MKMTGINNFILFLIKKAEGQGGEEKAFSLEHRNGPHTMEYFLTNLNTRQICAICF